MRFLPSEIPALFAGRLRTTRRLLESVDADTVVMRGDLIEAVLYPSGRLRWQVGRYYAIQAEQYGKRQATIALGTFRLDAIVIGRLRNSFEPEGPLSYHAAGYKTRTEAMNEWNWRAPKGKQWFDNPFVAVLFIEDVQANEAGAKWTVQGWVTRLAISRSVGG